MSGIRRRRTYDKEFKLEAVRLVLEEGHSARSVEQRLGTGQGVVYGWVHEFTDDPEHAFPGKGNLKAPDKELYELKRELTPRTTKVEENRLLPTRRWALNWQRC